MSRTKHHGKKAKEKSFGDNWYWMRNYPKVWDYFMHTRPRRAAEKKAIGLSKVDPDLGENVLFPLDHKPHQYYW